MALRSAIEVALLVARQAGKMLAGAGLPAEYPLDDGGVRSAAQADSEGFVAALGRRTVIDEV